MIFTDLTFLFAVLFVLLVFLYIVLSAEHWKLLKRKLERESGVPQSFSFFKLICDEKEYFAVLPFVIIFICAIIAVILNNLFILFVFLFVLLLFLYVLLYREYAKLLKNKLEKEGVFISKRDFIIRVLIREEKMPLGVTSLAIVFLCMIFGWNFLWDIGVYQGYKPPQPILFSHKVHAGDLKIPCEYCHSGVLEGKHAGVPPLSVCMGCHRVIDRGKQTGTTEIAKIYAAVGWNSEKQAYTEKPKPFSWVKVHQLPELAVFNHAQHVVVGGIECQTCHGPVEEMDVMYQFSELTMQWCVNCHRNTQVITNGNQYYNEVVKRIREDKPQGPIFVSDIGGLECYKCHY